jgi:hypothetical protein
MATIPSAYTWTVGELVTAAKMNAYLRDAVNFLLSPPYATLTHSTTQSFTTGTAAAVLFNSEVADTDNGHSTSSNTSRYTAQTAGMWKLDASTPWTSNGTGTRALSARTNGSTDNNATSMAAAAGTTAVPVSDRLNMSVGDYVEVVALQSSGGNLTIVNSAYGGQRMSLKWDGIA